MRKEEAIALPPLGGGAGVGVAATRPGRDEDPWIHPTRPAHQRFDKLGKPLPMERHGCGCGLCARGRTHVRRPQGGAPGTGFARPVAFRGDVPPHTEA